MKKKKQNTSSCPAHIPHEITLQVLARLPAKSLMRFKCVCKLWESTICDPQFVQSHHTFSRSRPDGNYFVTFWHFCQQDRVSISFKDVHGKSKVPPPIELQVKKNQFLYRDVAATEPLDGLICLYTRRRNSHALVLNISTRQIVHLPKVGFYGDFDITYFHRKRCLTDYVLGFDPVSSDYKVLKLCRFDNNAHIYNSNTIFKIYTLGTTSWRKLNVQFQGIPTLWMNSSSTCVNGTIYWLSSKFTYSACTCLTCFDVHNEVFRLVKLIPSGPVNPRQLFAVEGKLGVARVDRSRGENPQWFGFLDEFDQIGFGIMEENDRNQVLEEDYIGFSPDMKKTEGLRISGVSNKGELILVDDRRSRNVYFDLKTREWREKRFQWPAPGAFSPLIDRKFRYYHVENIVRLKDHDSTRNHDDNFLIE